MVLQFLKGAHRLRPGTCLSAPSWDLPLVLRSLTSAPYELLGPADLTFFTQETVYTGLVLYQEGERAARTLCEY